MAESNYRGYLKTDTVKAKKYFYVLRPILACRWIIDKGTPPPMLFFELASAELPEYLRPEVELLLDLKMNSPEIKDIPKIDVLNRYLDESIENVRNRIAGIGDSDNGLEKLNDLFLRTIAELNS